MNKFFYHVRTLALALALGFSATAWADNSYGLKDNIQDGVILHCFDWTADQIKGELQSIAEAGFTAVQLSPVHQKEGQSAWYMAYQPYDYKVGNSIASTSSLTALCTEAHKYGVKVIVDVVANHTNGNLTYVADRLKNTNLYHNYEGGIDYNDRWQVTHGKIGMWDLKTEDSSVQAIIKEYIAELKACGVDGIRWDAAKHIGLPSEGDSFWANVPDKSMYNYGEILDSAYNGDNGTLLKEYANYISFTDNGYGDGLAGSFNSGNVPTSIGNFNQKGVDNSKLVYWGESHDTYSNDGGSSKYISQNNIDKAYAIAAGNNKSTALYFSRPSATAKDAIKMATKGSTHFKDPEVAEVNHMHNLCAGEANYYIHENGVGAQLRKTGAIFVLGSGQSGSVNIANGSGSWLTPGTYTDKVGGGTFTVTASNISGQITKSGIAVIYSGTISKGSIAISPAGGSFTSDTQTVTLTGTDTKSIYYTIGSGAKQTSTNSTVSLTIGADMEYGESVTITYGGTNTDGEAISEKTATFTKKDPSATVGVYLQNAANWSTPIYCYAYDKAGTKDTGEWPGAQMTLDATTGYYTLDLTSYDLEDAYCIFYSASGRYPAEMADGLATGGSSKLFNNSTKTWTDYSPAPATKKPVVTMPASQTFSTKPYSVSISVTNATSASYTVNGGSAVSFTGSTTVSISETSTIKVTATNAEGTTEKSATYTYSEAPVVTGTTLFFKNTGNWSAVYCYVWKDNVKDLGEWPGTALTEKTSDGTYYYITLPEGSTATNVIFNCGNNSAQTGDLTIKDKEIYNASGDTGETYSGTIPTPTYEYIYFENSASWSSVYCYIWDANKNGVLGAWPGKAITTKTSDGKYYKVAVSESANAIGVIFNPGGESGKTGDLTYKANEIYNASGDTGKQYSGDTPTPSDKPVITMPTSQTFTTKPFSVSISVTNATSASYTVNSGAAVSFTGSTTVSISETSTITVTATNTAGTTTSSATYTYSDTPTPTPTPSKGNLASYYKTNPNGYGQKKTVNSYEDFTLNDIIAQGVANDDPRVYRPNSMYEVPIDLYALYGAYDDTNLYLAWDMTNVQDVVAPNDDYPLSQGILYQTMNVPFMILFDTQSGGSNGNTSSTGSTLWDTGITYPAIVNRVIMCSTNAANGPFIYENNGSLINPTEIYNATTSGINFKVSNFGLGIKSSNVYGIDGAYGTHNNRTIADMKSDNESSAAWVDFNTKGHKSSTLDFHYYMAIPLDKLGTSASQIESRGLGIMFVATMGKSGMDCLPYDLSMNDNADQPDTESQEFNSFEKSDADNITVAFAYLGKDASGVEEIDADANVYNGLTNVYSLSGTIIRANVVTSEATEGLASGVYIMKNAQGKYDRIFVK